MWQASYCAGITLWGYIYGKTWTTDGNSGLIKDGVERPAMTWLREYMASEKALQAKSPFPGMVKEASVYIKPEATRLPIEKPASIEVRATMRTKTIERVELFVNNVRKATMTEAPYVAEYTPVRTGKVNLKAIVYTTDGTKYERTGAFTAYEDLGDRKYTSLSQLTGGQPFAIVDETQAKALYCKDNQNLGFATYDQAFSNNVVGYYFKLVSLSGNADTSIRKNYLLRLLQVNGDEYNIWGNPGYLNTQPADQQCSFILGLNNQNGQDFKNGAVWDVQYVEGKGFTLKNIGTGLSCFISCMAARAGFTLKNLGTGLYLRDNGPAKYTDPTYFTFCTTGAATNIDLPSAVLQSQQPSGIYTLQGVKVGTTDQWSRLRPGLYLVDGVKRLKR